MKDATMSWLVFAFSGPVLWAISTHLDKYLVERFFKHSDVALLLLFTAFIGVLTLPFIAYFEPAFANIAPRQHRADRAVWHPLHGRDAVLSAGLAIRRSFRGGAVLPGGAAVWLCAGLFRPRRDVVAPANSRRRLIIVGTLFVSVRVGGGAGVFKLRLALLMLACGLAVALSG